MAIDFYIAAAGLLGGLGVATAVGTYIKAIPQLRTSSQRKLSTMGADYCTLGGLTIFVLQTLSKTQVHNTEAVSRINTASGVLFTSTLLFSSTIFAMLLGKNKIPLPFHPFDGILLFLGWATLCSAATVM